MVIKHKTDEEAASARDLRPTRQRTDERPARPVRWRSANRREIPHGSTHRKHGRLRRIDGPTANTREGERGEDADDACECAYHGTARTRDGAEHRHPRESSNRAAEPMHVRKRTGDLRPLRRVPQEQRATTHVTSHKSTQRNTTRHIAPPDERRPSHPRAYTGLQRRLHRGASRDAPSDATAKMYAAPRTRRRRVRQEGAARVEERGEERRRRTERRERGARARRRERWPRPPGSVRGVPAQSLRTHRASTGHARGSGRPSRTSPQTRRRRAAEEGAHSTELSARKEGRGRDESDSHGCRGAPARLRRREPPDHDPHEPAPAPHGRRPS